MCDSSLFYKRKQQTCSRQRGDSGDRILAGSWWFIGEYESDFAFQASPFSDEPLEACQNQHDCRTDINLNTSFLKIGHTQLAGTRWYPKLLGLTSYWTVIVDPCSSHISVISLSITNMGTFHCRSTLRHLLSKLSKHGKILSNSITSATEYWAMFWSPAFLTCAAVSIQRTSTE